MVAFNDVTKKATATIDLKKAIAVEDDQEARNNAQSPGGTSRYADEYDGLYGVERSFRLIFPQSQEIIFFADSDEEKSKWYKPRMHRFVLHIDYLLRLGLKCFGHLLAAFLHILFGRNFSGNGKKRSRSVWLLPNRLCLRRPRLIQDARSIK